MWNDLFHNLLWAVWFYLIKWLAWVIASAEFEQLGEEIPEKQLSFPPPSLHAMKTSPFISRQTSMQVWAVLLDIQPGAVKNNNMSKTLTPPQTTENGTRLRVDKRFKISRTSLEFNKCPKPPAYCSGSEDKKRRERKQYWDTIFMLTLLEDSSTVLLFQLLWNISHGYLRPM